MKQYMNGSGGVKLLCACVLMLAVTMGVADPAAAAAMGMVMVGDVEPSSLKDIEKAMKTAFATLETSIKKTQDTADNALEEVRKEGTLHKATNDKLTELSTAAQEAQGAVAELKTRMLDAEQKMSKKFEDMQKSVADKHKTAGKMFAESDGFKNMMAAKALVSAPVEIERKSILTTTFNNDQPLVQADRLPGIIMPAMRRLTIRDLLPQIPTNSNVIEYASELVFTNSAAAQYDTASPTGTPEGTTKAESQITFQLQNAVVITLAHWIGASKQILADAGQLSGYIDARLGYGLKLEEEDELLNSTGQAGELNGMYSQATAFNGGATNQTALDTLLRSFLQVSLSNYEASGVILHPYDWVGIQLLKDTTGRYLFSDPHSVELPRVWGKNVVPTASMTQGNFLTGAFDIGAAIYDREGMTIRISDQHENFFVKNLIAILCEERLAFVMYRPTAFVKGSINTPG